MNLVILTATLTILALFSNYSINQMKEIDYKNIILLEHKLVRYRYYKEVINNIFIVYIICSIAFSLIILSSYADNNMPNIFLQTIHISILLLINPFIIYFFSKCINNNYKFKIHPIIRCKIKSQIISNIFLVISILSGAIQILLWIFYLNISIKKILEAQNKIDISSTQEMKSIALQEFNALHDYGIINYIITILIWFAPIIVVFLLKITINFIYNLNISKNVFANNSNSNYILKLKLKDKETVIEVNMLTKDIVLDNQKNIIICERETNKETVFLFEQIEKISYSDDISTDKFESLIQ